MQEGFVSGWQTPRYNLILISGALASFDLLGGSWKEHLGIETNLGNTL